jgi:hypothetical protein
MRIPPVAGDSPLRGFATEQSSEFGSNHEQNPALVALRQRQRERLFLLAVWQGALTRLMAYVEDSATDGSLNKSV